jgi:Prokaryotic lipoprotein-attachment site
MEGEAEVMRTTLVILGAIALLSACGLRGGLERPGPMWGNPPNEGPLDPRTIKAAEEKAKAEAAKKKAEEEAARQQQQQQLQQQTPATPATPR